MSRAFKRFPFRASRVVFLFKVSYKNACHGKYHQQLSLTTIQSVISPKLVSLKSVLQRLYPLSGTSRSKSLSDVVADLELLCKFSFSNDKTGPL